MQKTQTFIGDVVIIGGGASGLMCAALASGLGHKVMLIERGDRAGRKVKASGGGRCNLTNLNVSAANYVSANPHFVKSALSRMRPDNVIEFFNRMGVLTEPEEGGKVFCSGGAQTLLNALLQLCKSNNVRIMVGAEIGEIHRERDFVIKTDDRMIVAKTLIIATGGKSYPQLGATGFGYAIAEEFGHAIVPLRPALVPMIFRDEEQTLFRDLGGVSFDVAITAGKKRFTGGMLFTGKGISGPVVLNASLYWAAGTPLVIDLLPGENAYDFLRAYQGTNPLMSNILSARLPQRFAKIFSTQYLGEKPIKAYSERELRRVAEAINRWSIIPAATEGFKAAEVTAGGVDTGDISSKTMESQKVQGLYFMGEVLDVTGELGGYNLHWAWASANAVANGL